MNNCVQGSSTVKERLFMLIHLICTQPSAWMTVRLITLSLYIWYTGYILLTPVHNFLRSENEFYQTPCVDLKLSISLEKVVVQLPKSALLLKNPKDIGLSYKKWRLSFMFYPDFGLNYFWFTYIIFLLALNLYIYQKFATNVFKTPQLAYAPWFSMAIFFSRLLNFDLYSEFTSCSTGAAKWQTATFSLSQIWGDNCDGCPIRLLHSSSPFPSSPFPSPPNSHIL